MKLFLPILFAFIFIANGAFARRNDSLQKDTTLITKAYSRQSVIAYAVPVAFITYGALSYNLAPLKNLDNQLKNSFSDHNHTFINHWDDFLQYSPALAVYGLNAINIMGKHQFADRTGTYLLAEAMMGTGTWLVKHETRRLRPNGLDNYSFPSGHAGTAFVAAEFLSQEYGDVSPWYSVGGYTVATAVAVLRVRNDYHLLSDVVAGAGIGIASAKVAYLVYPVIKHSLWPKKTLNITLVPAYQNNGLGFYLAGQF